MANNPTEVAAVFDRAADAYDNVGVDWFGPIAAGLVRELAVRPGERVLDVGCGRGAALLPLAEAAGPTGTVLGIDLSRRMVELTEADTAHLAQVSVRVGDARDPGVGGQDVVSACLVLFFLPEPGTVVQTWAGLLAPGGRLGVATFGPQDDNWRMIDSVFDPYLPTTLLDARTSGRRGPFASDEGVEALFSAAGLLEVRTVTASVVAEVRDVDQLVQFMWSHGQRAMWEAVPEKQHATVRAELAARVAASAPDGPLRLTQQVRYTLGRRA